MTGQLRLQQFDEYDVREKIPDDIKSYLVMFNNSCILYHNFLSVRW